MDKETIFNEFPMKLRERTDLLSAPVQAGYIVVIIRRPKSDPWTQSEPFKALWLTLKTIVNEKRDICLFVAIFGFCHITINYLHF